MKKQEYEHNYLVNMKDSNFITLSVQATQLASRAF